MPAASRTETSGAGTPSAPKGLRDKRVFLSCVLSLFARKRTHSKMMAKVPEAAHPFAARKMSTDKDR